MSKKPRGNIHKIREFELEKINLVDEFDILQIVGEGWFGKILLVEHRASQTEMVLKAVPKPYVSLRDFYREFHYGLHLGIHRNIVTTYDVAFETAGFYIFTQEYAPLGDLTSNVTDTGVGEAYSKRVAKQIASALDYMHSKDIVHRDVKLDNVLIYRPDFSRVKLCDFGESFQTGTVVERRNEWLPYSPPEVLDIKPEGTYKADPNHDVWQFGIVIFVCLTGCLPWQKAASDDPRFMRYLAWQGSMILPIRRTPKLFKLLSSRAQRMFRRFLEPKPDRRPKNLTDLSKFLDDRWLAKTAEKEMAEYETDVLCPSMYSFHSSPDEKHRLLYTLADCGIETNVDRQTKKNRIKDWIESSVITEEDEEELDENNSASPSSSISREPVPGHISSIRAASQPKEIKTTLKDSTHKHFDPRTGALQQGPSEMGTTLPPHHNHNQKSASPSISNISTLNNGDSLCSSLLTLGSRQDLIASNLQMYNSDMDLNRLGELDKNFDPNERYLNQTLSSGNLLTTAADKSLPPFLNPINNSNFGAMKTPVGILRSSDGAGGRSSGNKSILQRSKSDSVKAVMYASSPAIDNTYAYASTQAYPTNRQQIGGGSGNAPNGSSFFVNEAGKPNVAMSQAFNTINNNNNSKSVSFTGLTNDFQSLAQISLPAHASNMYQQLQQQQSVSTYFNPKQNDSQVKDSAYGSAEVSEKSTKHTVTFASSNGNIDKMTPLQQQPYQRQHMVNNRNPRSDEQRREPQHAYRGALTTNSMKDTAYDRVVPENNAKKRR